MTGILQWKVKCLPNVMKHHLTCIIINCYYHCTDINYSCDIIHYFRCGLIRQQVHCLLFRSLSITADSVSTFPWPLGSVNSLSVHFHLGCHCGGHGSVLQNCRVAGFGKCLHRCLRSLRSLCWVTCCLHCILRTCLPSPHVFEQCDHSSAIQLHTEAQKVSVFTAAISLLSVQKPV